MKKGEAEVQTIEVARTVRRKVSFLLRKTFIEQREVYALTKSFFKAYLQKEFEFTAEELQKELHKVYLSNLLRTRTDTLIEKLGLLEYTDTQYSQAELKMLLQDLDGIIKDLVVEHKRRIPALTRFANWLFRKKAPKKEIMISDIPTLEPNDRVTVEINTIIEDIYAALDKNKVKKAAKHYKRLMQRYHQLGTHGQEGFYHKIQAAYEAIVKQQ